MQPRSLVTMAASVTEAREAGLQAGVFTLTRQGDTSAALTVSSTSSADRRPRAPTTSRFPGTALFGAGAGDRDDYGDAD